MAWTEPLTRDGSVDSYKVSLYLAGTGTLQSVTTVQTLEHTFVGLVPDTDYNVTVAASNRWGTGNVAFVTVSTDAITPSYAFSVQPGDGVSMQALSSQPSLRVVDQVCAFVGGYLANYVCPLSPTPPFQKKN